MEKTKKQKEDAIQELTDSAVRKMIENFHCGDEVFLKDLAEIVELLEAQNGN